MKCEKTHTRRQFTGTNFKITGTNFKKNLRPGTCFSLAARIYWYSGLRGVCYAVSSVMILFSDGGLIFYGNDSDVHSIFDGLRANGA